MELRDATPDDVRLLWLWATDELTRAQSFSPESIAWEEHLSWWERVQRDPFSRVLIGQVDGHPIGSARFDGAPTFAVISIVVAPEQRGRGLAAPLIAAATCVDGRTTHAYVLPDNVASVRAFVTAGYRLEGNTEIRGRTALAFFRSRRW